jgi:hypothetical protein
MKDSFDVFKYKQSYKLTMNTIEKFTQSFIKGIGKASGSIVVIGITGAVWYAMSSYWDQKTRSSHEKTRTTSQQTGMDNSSLEFTHLFDQL